MHHLNKGGVLAEQLIILTTFDQPCDVSEMLI